MRAPFLAAIGAATLVLATPAFAQEVPLVSGDFWSVAEITIDDGHFSDYADYLAGNWRKIQEFNKSKGWIKGYHILSNNNKRASEPDLYLVTITDHVPTPAEDLAREKDFNTFMASTSRAQDAQSGVRAKYRHVGGSSLLLLKGLGRVPHEGGARFPASSLRRNSRGSFPAAAASSPRSSRSTPPIISIRSMLTPWS